MRETISDEGYIVGKCPEVENCRGLALAGTLVEYGERLPGRNVKLLKSLPSTPQTPAQISRALEDRDGK